MCGLNLLGGFQVFWVIVWTCRRILHSLNLLKRPEAIEVGEGALSKLLAGKVYDYLVFPRYRQAATGALALFRNRMFRHPRQLSVRRFWRASTET